MRSQRMVRSMLRRWGWGKVDREGVEEVGGKERMREKEDCELGPGRGRGLVDFFFCHSVKIINGVNR